MKCTKCGSENIKEIKPGHYECKACGHYFDRTEFELNQEPEMENDWLL